MDNKNQLIIIGNGFDIQCGLKSTFNSFFDYCEEKEIDNLIQNILKSRRTANVNNWSDIEGAIKDFLSENKHMLRMKIDFKPYYRTLGLNSNKNKFIYNFLPKRYFPNEKPYAYLDIESKAIEENNMKYKNKIQSDIFFNELNEYEEIFREYLNIQLKGLIFQGTTYDQEAVSLLSRITNLLYKSNTHILNFNYTTAGAYEMGQDIRVETRNIHGSLRKGTSIFGIDQMGISSNSELTRFTKTYRILTENYGGEEWGLSEEYDYIKFYGHSLSEADYSYFHSIFDNIDIYNSSVKLCFFYELYKNEAEIRKELLASVQRLLEKYGETLPGAQGNNLLHKLMLENRIIIDKLR